MHLKCCILWKGNEALLRGTNDTWARWWGWQQRDAENGKGPNWPERTVETGKVLREEPIPGLHKAWQHQVAASCLFLFLPSQKNKKNSREYLSQDRSLLSWPRILVRSNKAALPSAKSSVGISGGIGRAKARGALPGDSNTKPKTQLYQDTAFPREEIMVKSSPFRAKSELKELYSEY